MGVSQVLIGCSTAQVSEKTNEPIPRKVLDGWTDRWKDWQGNRSYFIGPFRPRPGVLHGKHTNTQTNKQKNKQASKWTNKTSKKTNIEIATDKCVNVSFQLKAMKKVWWSLLLCLQKDENSKMFAKDFISHRFHVSMFVSLFLYLP